MIKRNQLGVIQNYHQGKIKKVLTVCSAGCLRSPTAAHILSSEPWNYNTRCAGNSEEYAIIPVTEALIVWADVILVMNSFQQKHINDMQNKIATDFEGMYGGMYYDFQYKQVIDLDIEDNYGYRDPELVRIMTEKFNEIFPIEE
jgi:predicted protein tyrosine phosphatase